MTDFFFRKLIEFRPNFFSNIKKLPKLFLKFFSNFFFENFFVWKYFSTNFFFEENVYHRIFFRENLSFYKNISAKIFFTILSRISFVFDVCEIMYFAEFFIRNFAYCDFFLFCNYGVRKKNCKFFLQFFSSDECEYQIWKYFFSEKK